MLEPVEKLDTAVAELEDCSGARLDPALPSDDQEPDDALTSPVQASGQYVLAGILVCRPA